MVRVNLIKVKHLADQHLVAEYGEIIMLVKYMQKYPSLEDLPKHYTLNKGHMRFFKDKGTYLKERHKQIIQEMKRRGFVPTKKITGKLPKSISWKPSKKDKDLVKARIMSRLRKKPSFYKYYRKKTSLKFLLNLVKNG